MARLFPRSLGEVVGKAAKPLFRKRGFAESSILLEWPQIVGELLANHCIPLKIVFPRNENTHGTLTVTCSPAFAPELQQLTPILLEKLATHMGYKAIDRIQIEQQHHSAKPKPNKMALKNLSSPQSSREVATDEDPVASALARLEKIRHQRKNNSTQ